MIRSMTAFARCERHTEPGAIAWELRTVNHRYLEISLRMPETLRALDLAVRERVQGRLTRGKVDASLRFQPATSSAPELTLNRAYAERLLGIFLRGDAELTEIFIRRLTHRLAQIEKASE